MEPAERSWVVHKFGGTSVASGTRIIGVAKLVIDEWNALASQSNRGIAVVVSAMGGVTNRLLKCITLAEQKDATYLDLLKSILADHEAAIDALQLTDNTTSKSLKAWLSTDAQDLKDILHAIALTQSCSKAARDRIASYGELWSSEFLHRALKDRLHETCGHIDAREFVTVEETDVGPSILWPQTADLMQKYLVSSFEKVPPVWIIPGFVCRTPAGLPTTLSRNGSDFSATIFGSLLCAAEVHIWTDVDGIYSADPRKVPSAVLLDQMSYTEALELSYFGAKVLHHQSIQPVMIKGIPLWIRNTFRPSCPGTKITVAPASAGTATSVKGFSLIDEVRKSIKLGFPRFVLILLI